jgi:6-phosphogluconolactonase (cycloisomerase 2 family)
MGTKVWMAAAVLSVAGTARAQTAVVWAGANDAPNTLITGTWDGATMAFLPEVPSGGDSAGGDRGFSEGQVRAYVARGPGECSLLAQTNPSSGNLSLYTLDASGVAAPVAGSPFPIDGSTTAIAWARDGQALYVSRAVVGPAVVATFRVGCVRGQPTAVGDAGSVTLSSIESLRDMDVTASGGHLCVTGTGSHNVGCFAIDPATRVPSAAPANTVTIPSPRGLRISGATGCGVLGMPQSNQVSGFTVADSGSISLTNAAPSAAPAFHGAVSPDGTFAAFGSSCCRREVALYALGRECQLRSLGSTERVDSGGAPYVAFDAANRLYVADYGANRIRVFQASAAGAVPVGAGVTDHGRSNPPIGIDAALLSALAERPATPAP